SYGWSPDADLPAVIREVHCERGQGTDTTAARLRQGMASNKLSHLDRWRIFDESIGVSIRSATVENARMRAIHSAFRMVHAIHWFAPGASRWGWQDGNT